MKWAQNIDNYDSLSTEDKNEMKQAMEEEYGIHLFNNWNFVKHILLLYIKLHLTILGDVIAIFSRDEYQCKVENLCHNHLIAAIDKRTMNDNAENFIQDLIRTNVLELVKTDEDINRLIGNGLLKSADEITEVTAQVD